MKLTNTILDGFRSLKDGSMKITLVTRELSPEQLALLTLNLNKEILSVEVPDELGDRKSPSQRLRDRMAVYYKETYPNLKSFNTWYQDTLDQIGQTYLDKLK